jgi:hypothetical protein
VWVSLCGYFASEGEVWQELSATTRIPLRGPGSGGTGMFPGALICNSTPKCKRARLLLRPPSVIYCLVSAGRPAVNKCKPTFMQTACARNTGKAYVKQCCQVCSQCQGLVNPMQRQYRPMPLPVNSWAEAGQIQNSLLTNIARRHLYKVVLPQGWTNSLAFRGTAFLVLLRLS